MMVRADLLSAICLTACALFGGAHAAPKVPSALTTPAVMSARSERSALLAVARAGQRLVAAGERGVVLWSDDHGHSWRQAKVPVRTALTALQFVDERRGWAVGHFGVVLRTDDGGENWSLQLDGMRAAKLAQAAATKPGERAFADQLVQDGPDKPLLALHFSDERNGLVLGAYNLALRTTDGGKSWSYIGHQLPNPKRLHLYGIAVAGDQVTVVGEQGLLMGSRDAGLSFQPVDSPYPGSYFGVLAHSPDTVLAYGLRGSVFRIDLQAKKWQKVEVPVSSSLGASLSLSDGRLLLAGQSGELLLSSDQGRSFKRLLSPPAPLAALAQAANGAIVLGTLRGPAVLPLPR